MIRERQHHLIAAGSISLGVSVIIVSLRFVARKYVLGKISLDDWLMLVALASVVTFSILCILLSEEGAGLHIAGVSQGWTPLTGNLLLGAEITYNTTIFFAKISILTFYLKFIPRDTKLRTATWVVIGFVSTIFPIKIIVIGLKCIPYKKSWDPTIPGKCINWEAFSYCVATYNIFTDTAIFVLPLRLLWKIKRSQRERILLVSLFGVSFFAVVISFLRIYSLVLLFEGSDPLWDTAPILVWSLLECCMGIFCGSVPALKPLFLRNKVLSKSKAAKVDLSSALYELKRPSVSTIPPSRDTRLSKYEESCDVPMLLVDVYDSKHNSFKIIDI